MGPARVAALAALGVIDRLTDGTYRATRWLVLVMIVLGAFNALARYATRYTGVAMSSNAALDVQWYLFAVVFLLGAAYGLPHGVHVRVDVVHERLPVRARAWIELIGTVLLATVMVVGALGVVLLRQPVHAALALVGTLLALAVTYVTLQAAAFPPST